MCNFLDDITDQCFFAFNLDESPFSTICGKILSTKRNIWMIEQANKKMDFCHLDYMANQDNSTIDVRLKLTMEDDKNNH